MQIRLSSAEKVLREGAQHFRSEVLALDLVLKAIKRLAQYPEGLELDFAYIESHMTAVRNHLLQGMPLAYCNCKEPLKCKRCKGKRWVTLRGEALASLPEDISPNSHLSQEAPLERVSVESNCTSMETSRSSSSPATTEPIG